MALSTAEKKVVQERAPAARRREAAWVSIVSVLALLLGTLAGLLLSTQRQMRDQGLPPTRYGATAALMYNHSLNQRLEELQSEHRRLQARINQYEDQLAAGTEATTTLHRSLREARFLAGLTPVKGRGIIVTLRDSPKQPPAGVDRQRLMIHDDDLIYFLNELRAAGAEAMALAGVEAQSPHRIVAQSAVRCVGPVVHVNGVPIAGPYTIYAVGSPKDLRNALEMPGGIIRASGMDVLGMVQIEERSEIIIPAFAGTLEPREAQPVDEGT